MQLLLLYAAYDGVTQLLSRALTAVGDTQFTMRLGLALAVLMPAGFVAGAQWGPAGIAAAWLLIAPAARGALLLRARRKIGLSLRSYAASLWPAVSATIVMAIAVIAVRRTFDGSAVPIRLAAAVAGGAAAYVLACVVLHRPRLSAALDMGRRMLRS
jgi:hypothetical protein